MLHIIRILLQQGLEAGMGSAHRLETGKSGFSLPGHFRLAGLWWSRSRLFLSKALPSTPFATE